MSKALLVLKVVKARERRDLFVSDVLPPLLQSRVNGAPVEAATRVAIYSLAHLLR